MEGAKMSKSKGNVARPDDYIARFGVDGLRYFVFREMVFGQDANFGDEAILTRYNADLANDLGNLVSRVTTLIHRSCGGTVPRPDAALHARGDERALDRAVAGVIETVKASIGSFQLNLALRDVWEVIGASNRYIVTREPWKLSKDESRRAELDTTLFVAADTLRVLAELLRPFMPETADRTLAMLGIEPASTSWVSLQPGTLTPGTKLGATSALFPRIDLSVEEIRQMADPQPSATPASEPDGRISIDDFLKVDLRVARVLAAERVPKSTRLLKLTVDVGSEQRTIVAGIAEAYEPEGLVGRTIAVVFNLKPAKLMGVESNGMVLAASPDAGTAMLVGFDGAPQPGTKIR
jgi:methionyl-tRNA synthetase